MHAMVDGTMAIDAIDRAMQALAAEGAELVRTYSSAARRMKKHREKVLM